MKFILNFTVILFLSITVGFGQKDYKPLKIGDKVPDVFLTGLRNYKSQNAKFSDFKGKVIILDFWNKFCSSCITAFPKMEKLQAEFTDKLEVLLVTNDTEETLKGLFQNSPIVKNTKLPFIINDKVLHQLFPHRSVPFHVWIDAKGIVKAFATAQNEATAENIKTVIDGKDPVIAKFASQDDFDDNKPLIVEGAGRQWEHLQYYSMVMRGIVGVNAFSSGSLKDPITEEDIINSRRIHNTQVLNLFQDAYSDRQLKIAKYIVEGKHSEDFFMPGDIEKLDAWRDTMVYSYESIFPAHVKDRGQKVMQQTLRNYFGVTGAIEKRKEKCYILYRISEENRLISKGGEELYEYTTGGWIVKNFYFDGLLRGLLSKNFIGKKNQPVVFDETGYDGMMKVDINLKSGLSDLPVLQKELAQFGIGIKIEEREINCLVLRDIE